MNDLYADHCEHCGGLDLPDLSDNDFEDIYTQIARELLESKRDNGYINNDLYFKTANKLIEGMNSGLGATSFAYNDSRAILSSYLKHNLYAFSAAKSYTEMLHFRDLMVDEEGKIRGFESFKKQIADAGYVFNNNYLSVIGNATFLSILNTSPNNPAIVCASCC